MAIPRDYSPVNRVTKRSDVVKNTWCAEFAKTVKFRTVGMMSMCDPLTRAKNGFKSKTDLNLEFTDSPPRHDTASSFSSAFCSSRSWLQSATISLNAAFMRRSLGLLFAFHLLLFALHLLLFAFRLIPLHVLHPFLRYHDPKLSS